MKKLSSIFGGLLVIAIAVVFIVQFRPATEVPVASAPTCAVEVASGCVSSTQFWAAYRLLAPRGADEAKLKAMGLRRQTAEGLVERQLLLADAKRLGITVSDDELTRELASGRAHVSLPADKARQLGYALGIDESMFRLLDVRDNKTKKFDTKSYEREVRGLTKMSPTDYRDFQKEELIAARMRDIIRQRARVGEAEAFSQFSREKATATLHYVRLKRSFYAETVVDQSQKAVETWAEANKDEVEKVWGSRKAQFLPECRITQGIVVKVDPTAPDPDAEKARVKAKIQGALDAIKGGKSFGDVARDVSEDASSERDGDLGCMTKGRMPKPVEDVLMAMEPGKPSEIIETEMGDFLLQVVKVATGEDAEKAGKAQTTRELYVSHEAERLAAGGAKEILAATRGGKSLEDAIAAHLAALPRREAAADKKAAGKPRKKDDAAADGKRMLTVDTHPERPALDVTLPFNASGDPIEGVAGESVAGIAFKLAKAGDVPQDIIPMEDGYAVIQLKEKTPASDEQWQKDREFYVSAMRAAKQSDALVSYVKRLKSTLGSEIKYNASLVEEPKGDATGPDGEGDLGEE